MKSLLCKDHARIESAFCPLPTITANGHDKYSTFFKENLRKLLISCGDKLGIDSGCVCQYPTNIKPCWFAVNISFLHLLGS